MKRPALILLILLLIGILLLVGIAGSNVYYPLGNVTISNFFNATNFVSRADTATFYNAFDFTSNSNVTTIYTTNTTTGGGDTSHFLFLNGSRIMTGDLNLGNNNITSVGYLDKLAQMVDPGTPPAKTLRLYAEYDPQTGFTVYKYKDDSGMVRELVRDSMFNVEGGYNNDDTDIPPMNAVYDCGSDSQVPLVCLAQANSMSTLPANGISIEKIGYGAPGRVMMVGLLENVNTNAWNEGDALYVSATVPGGLTNVKPVSPALSQEMGVVLVKDATAGKIQVLTKSVTGNEFGTINNFTIVGNLRVMSPKTPASSTAICNQGEINWDTNYIYVCIATNTWKRTGLSIW
jgi:hypothetical protein